MSKIMSSTQIHCAKFLRKTLSFRNISGRVIGMITAIAAVQRCSATSFSDLECGWASSDGTHAEILAEEQMPELSAEATAGMQGQGQTRGQGRMSGAGKSALRLKLENVATTIESARGPARQLLEITRDMHFTRSQLIELIEYAQYLAAVNEEMHTSFLNRSSKRDKLLALSALLLMPERHMRTIWRLLVNKSPYETIDDFFIRIDPRGTQERLRTTLINAIGQEDAIGPDLLFFQGIGYALVGNLAYLDRIQELAGQIEAQVRLRDGCMCIFIPPWQAE
ncbi:MAG: hypothetical protein LBJ42_00825 [Holosporales bacterium]|nr:hypothetical protein [Holosporales bacterium]